MDERTTKITCEHHQLKLVHRWLDELDGGNKYKAYELMQLVMAVEITNEEAFALLEGE